AGRRTVGGRAAAQIDPASALDDEIEARQLPGAAVLGGVHIHGPVSVWTGRRKRQLGLSALARGREVAPGKARLDRPAELADRGRTLREPADRHDIRFERREQPDEQENESAVEDDDTSP